MSDPALLNLMDLFKARNILVALVEGNQISPRTKEEIRPAIELIDREAEKYRPLSHA